MPVLYVTQNGAVVRKTGRRLVVAAANAVIQSIRLRDLEQLVLVGAVEITGAAMKSLLEAGIDTTFLSGGGRLQGRLAPPAPKNVFLRVAQVKRHEDVAFRVATARRVVVGKIHNARRLLQLASRRGSDVSQAVATLQRLEDRCAGKASLAELLGMEGEAAAVYFEAYGSLFSRELAFKKRSRRPPRDPVNAMLSLAYTVLCGEAVGAVVGRGLDPDVGFLHELDYGRPSLALDLVEEFRQPVVDRLVLSMCNHGVMKRDDFEERNGGVMLKDEPRRKFFRFYDRAMTAGPCFREVLRTQAGRLARCVLEGSEYEPFRMA